MLKTETIDYRKWFIMQKTVFILIVLICVIGILIGCSNKSKGGSETVGNEKTLESNENKNKEKEKVKNKINGKVSKKDAKFVMKEYLESVKNKAWEKQYDLIANPSMSKEDFVNSMKAYNEISDEKLDSYKILSVKEKDEGKYNVEVKMKINIDQEQNVSIVEFDILLIDSSLFVDAENSRIIEQ